jgi:glycosyltransferase involved in cell wall biosynthesis
MKNANCLIVPSLCYENSPTVIYEAIAVGLPIIASKIGGITELLLDYGGIMFDPGDERELSDKMNWIIKNTSIIKKGYSCKYPLIEKNNSAEYVKRILKLL